MTRSLQVALAFLAFAVSSAAQQAQPRSTPPVDGMKGRTFSGRVLDGLDRSGPGAKVTVGPNNQSLERASEVLPRTGQDGRSRAHHSSEDRPASGQFTVIVVD